MNFARLRSLIKAEYKDSSGRIFVSGTGRAGTSFLMQLFTDLGLDTGFEVSLEKGAVDKLPNATNSPVYFETARAGFERNIFLHNNPLIVKSPYLCDHVDDLILSGIKIRHLVIPIRDVAQAAQSRRFVQKATKGESDSGAVAGGLWDTENAKEQEEVLALKLCRLIEAGARNNIPMTFLSFPHFVRDADYTYDKLRFMLPLVSKNTFLKCFHLNSKPDLVHDFSKST